VNKKTVLFISYDGMTDPLGQSQVIPYLAGLSKDGYEFVILSCDKPEKYKANKTYVEKLIAPYPITWVSIPYHKNPPVLSSVYDFFMLKQTAKQLHKQYHFSMVHTRPGVPQLVALYLKKKLGIKFMNDIRGFWADERVDGGMWDLKNPLYKMVYNFFRRKEDECVRIADYNTCLTYKGMEIMRSWKQVPQPVKVAVVPCSVDLELFNPDAIDQQLKAAFKKELNISDNDFIISYLGSIGGWYMTKEMMQFCKLLLNKKPEARFLFISNNNHEDIIAAAAEFDIPADKIMVKMGKRHEVPVLLSFSNYSLFFIKPCYSKLSSSPTKHGEIMAMGIPVIANSGVGDVKEIIEKYKAGFVLDEFTPAAMNAVVDKVCDNNIVFNKDELRAGARDFYNLDKTLLTYITVYKTVLN
jgi:glycosyltransferase involved in cell wall biosynthesis